MKTLVAENTGRRKESFRVQYLLQLIQWLSLDVSVGAMCSAALVGYLLDIQPLPWFAIGILGVVVWIIYTVDHLYDVHRMPGKPVTGRHLFHWQHKRKLQIFTGILITLTGLAVLVVLPGQLIIFGAVLGSVVLGYIWLVNMLKAGQARKWFHKEICVGVVYTAGVWGIGLIQAVHISAIHWLLAFAFGLIVWQNLFLFSYYELVEDIRQQQRSVVKTWGKTVTKKVIGSLFLLFAADGLLIFFLTDDPLVHQVLLGYVGMSAILAVLFIFPYLFRKNYRYRLIGDAVFLIPGFLLLNELLFT